MRLTHIREGNLLTQFIDSNAHLSQKHPHRHTLDNNWQVSGHCVAQLSGHIKPSNTGESKGGREWGVSCSKKRYILQSLVQDKMAKVKRVELGEARGWWMLPYGGKNWVTASALRLLQSLSSSIFRKVISLLAPGANSSCQEGILWWWRHHHQVDALVKSWNTLGTIFGQGDGIFENLPSASPAHAGLLRFIELILSYRAAPILQCSDSNLNGGSPHPLAVSVGQESRSSWNCVVLTQGLSWGCSQDVDWGCDSPLTPWQDAGYSSKMIPSHGCHQEIPVSCQLFEQDLSSSPCEPLSGVVSMSSQHGSWLPLEKLIPERARRKL